MSIRRKRSVQEIPTPLCFGVSDTTRDSYLHELSRQPQPCSADAVFWKDLLVLRKCFTTTSSHPLFSSLLPTTILLSWPQLNLTFLFFR